jgi:short-subunit dehydrogenase
VKIAGRFVLITGASSGIGAASARAMARNGARLALLARTRSDLEKVMSGLKGTEACMYPLDLADPQAVAEAAKRIQSDMGTPDILINSAGAGRWLFADETTPAEAMQMMAAPYFAAFYTTRAFLPDMLKRDSGCIVNINSPAAWMPWPGATAYSAARWALKGFTEALRADVWGTGLCISSIMCGKVDTAYFTHNPGSLERSPTIARIMPTLSADQVAEAIVRAVEHNRREIVIPFMLRVFYAAHHWFPRLVERLVYGTGWTYRKRET